MSPDRKRPRIWLPPGNLSPSLIPILGKQAKRQINEVKTEDRGLATQLTERVIGLLDDGATFDAELIPDPPHIGPRYLVDLLDGFVAVYWVVFLPGRRVPVIWVEQVMLRSEAEDMLAELAPTE
jgi:hypothetical protein